MKYPIELPYQLVLGSKSPRRKELLLEMGLDFEIRSKEFDEVVPDHIDSTEAPEYLAKLKGESFKSDLQAGELIITADTLVLLDGNILGKPKDKNEALDMITALSGNTHQVITGVSLISTKKQTSFSDSTSVQFYNLSPKEIKYYVEKFEPYDKAGGYGIQEWIGLIGALKVNGCFYNVIGLPVPRLYQVLKRF